MQPLKNLGLRQVLAHLRWGLILGTLATSWTVLAASKLHPHADTLKTMGNQRMLITRYSGHPNFHSQDSLVWRKEGERFKETNQHNVRVLKNHPDCESALAEQQLFSLGKYRSTGYLNGEAIREVLETSLRLNPGQVNFAQITRDVPENKAYELFGDKVREHEAQMLSNRVDDDVVPIVTATMWSIGGQVLEPEHARVKRLDMPWQKDAARAELAKKFDRSKYKWVWEWGRTAQDIPREFEPLASALAAINYQELLAFDGKLEDAYVMFHSFDEVNTRAYSMRFPGRLYPDNSADKNDALFLVPLAEVMRQFPPSRYSAKIHKLIELSGGKLDELRALEFLTRFDRIQFTQLDMYPDGARRQSVRPIAVHDLSFIADYRRGQLVEQFGLHLVPRFAELRKFLGGELRYKSPTFNLGQYTDLADVQMSVHYFAARKAVEISNLDKAMAAADPKYIERLLIGVFMYYVKELANHAQDWDLVKQIVQGLREENVRFGFSTFDSALAARIRKLGPVDQHHWTREYIKGSERVSVDSQVPWITQGYVTPPQSFVFTVEQILKLINTDGELYGQALNAFDMNGWARHLLLTHPDVF